MNFQHVHEPGITPLRTFWYWIAERHRIWEARQQGKPWPWTTDPILRAYRFCNVFREEDTVTQWIREHWRTPLHQKNDPIIVTMMTLARLINWPETLEELEHYAGAPWEWDPMRVRLQLLQRQEQGKKVYTGAYMLRGPSGGGDKPAYTVHIVKAVHNHITLPMRRGELYGVFKSIQQATEALMEIDGIGGFLAYEIATDLRHTFAVDPVDKFTFANAGPGALRGLNRLHERPLHFPLPQRQAVSEMQELLRLTRSHLPGTMFRERVFELRDIEHSLCETDKYLRVLNGEGKPRNRYTPPAEVIP